jgi:TfoX/Sxy family transcriptional regulator of competence genes
VERESRPMAYDEQLAERLRGALKRKRGVAEKKMFGGLTFLVNGNMAVGIVGDDLMVRVGADATQDALAQPHARPMDFTGRPMKGMVFVAPAGLEGSKKLAAWVDRGVRHARTLPKK